MKILHIYYVNHLHKLASGVLLSLAVAKLLNALSDDIFIFDIHRMFAK